MPQQFDPRLDILPAAQLELWTHLSPAPRLSFVLYGGTAIALFLGHRQSIDFDFFRTDPLDKELLRKTFDFFDRGAVIQDAPDTLAVLVHMPSGPVRVSFFGGIEFGRVNEPLQTRDGTLLVASLDDLMATKLKALLDRADAKDYRDIAQMISAGVSLAAGLGAFKRMFKGEPAQVLRAIGYFKDGDLPTLPEVDQELLRNARDRIADIPEVQVTPGSLAVPIGARDKDAS
jgi:hypothetical protein